MREEIKGYDTGGGPPEVGVFIVNWNTADLLRSCLASLSRLPEAPSLRTVVIDNGSIDDSVLMVESEFPGVKLIQNRGNEGFGRAHNQAFASTDTPYVLFLNSDAEVEPGTIDRCRRHLIEHPEVGAVGCRVRYPDGEAQNSVFRYPSLRAVVSTTFFLAQIFPNSDVFNRDRYGSAMPEEPTPVEVVMGSFIMVRRGDVEPAPFDDEFFMYAEEADLCRRLARSGKQIVFLPEVSIIHQKGGSSRTWAQRAWSDEAKKRAMLRFLLKWDGPATAWLANLVMLIGLVPRLAAWAAGDLASRVRGGTTGRLGKARALPFHLRTLIHPSGSGQRFHGPPSGASTPAPLR